MKKRALVCGGCGFIGSHLSKRLIFDGYETVLVDLKPLEFRELLPGETYANGDLRDPCVADNLMRQRFDETYALAADMGGAGHVFTGDNDADIMHNSATINLNMLDAMSKHSSSTPIFYSSSACMYPERNQLDPENPNCAEDSAYPAAPDSEYGWEKLFSERLYLAYARNKNLRVRIARFHNIYGAFGTWRGGREKAPAALCRKVAEARDGGEIEIWGDGQQTRSFLHVDECVEGILRLMRSDFVGPVNVGSEEMVTIDRLAEMIVGVSGKELSIRHVAGPLGVRGRCSDNRLIRDKLGWAPSSKLMENLPQTYRWIEEQVKACS